MHIFTHEEHIFMLTKYLGLKNCNDHKVGAYKINIAIPTRQAIMTCYTIENYYKPGP